MIGSSTKKNTRDVLLDMFRKIYRDYAHTNVSVFFNDIDNKVMISNGKLIKEIVFPKDSFCVRCQMFYVNEIIRDAFLEKLRLYEDKLKNRLFSEIQNDVHTIFFVTKQTKFKIIEENFNLKTIKYYLKNIDLIEKFL